MAFDRSKLAGTYVGNGRTIWTYETTDTKATVNTADYFLGAINDIKKWDFILATCDTGGTPTPVIFWVNANTGSSIDVADGLDVGTTDTD